MFDDMDVAELCAAIEKAFYSGYNEHAKTLLTELSERLEHTSI